MAKLRIVSILCVYSWFKKFTINAQGMPFCAILTLIIAYSFATNNNMYTFVIPLNDV